ncbi:MAG: exonuclease domain-containing protein [Psychromonas sp.]
MIKHLLRSSHPLEKLEKQRKKFLKREDIAPHILPYFKNPIPKSNTNIDELSFVIIDFETTGLDPTGDEILSVGLIELKNQILSLSTAEHYYLLTTENIKPETAVINHIVPETLSGGLNKAQFIEKILSSLKDRVVVAHCSTIEKKFLEKALNLPHGVHLPIVWIDTLVLESSLFINKNNFLPDYRLCTIRERKGLPSYLAHNALADAVATGELLLVLIQDIFSNKNHTIGDLFVRSKFGK